MMELILSRHGETLENQQHILQGQLPGTLSPLGIAQAERLAEMLQEETINNIVSSDLARSYNTAVAVARKHGLTPHQTPPCGKWTGAYTRVSAWMTWTGPTCLPAWNP